MQFRANSNPSKSFFVLHFNARFFSTENTRVSSLFMPFLLLFAKTVRKSIVLWDYGKAAGGAFQ